MKLNLNSLKICKPPLHNGHDDDRRSTDCSKKLVWRQMENRDWYNGERKTNRSFFSANCVTGSTVILTNFQKILTSY